MENTNNIDTARETIDTLREFSYRSENPNELARVSLGLIDAMSHLMSDADIADKVADKIDAAGLVEKARFLSRRNN